MSESHNMYLDTRRSRMGKDRVLCIFEFALECIARSASEGGLVTIFLVAARVSSLDPFVVVGTRFWDPGLGWCLWLSHFLHLVLSMGHSLVAAVCAMQQQERATW